jgi:hypothetical protein
LISWLCGFWRDLQDDSFWWYEGLNSGPRTCYVLYDLSHSASPIVEKRKEICVGEKCFCECETVSIFVEKKLNQDIWSQDNRNYSRYSRGNSIQEMDYKGDWRDETPNRRRQGNPEISNSKNC